MGKILRLKRRDARDDNLITQVPMEFRRSRWSTVHFVQMRKELSQAYEREFEEKGPRAMIPSHFVLDRGLEFTILGLFSHRESPGLLEEIYFLTALVDLLINKVSPILRTDLIRGVYNKVFELKNRFNMFWSGPIYQVLLPIEPGLHDEMAYRNALREVRSLKELYGLVREEVGEMLTVLCHNYVFYCPNPRG